jgi:hypothetical protein
MRAAKRLFLAVMAVGLSGCIYYVQQPQTNSQPSNDYVQTPPPPQPAPPPPVPVVDPAPAPAPAVEVVQYAPPPPAVVVVYQDDLSPYGQWIVHPRYGRVWRPFAAVSYWQPYTVGHWVYTDDGSCYWVSEGSEAAWGGIVYHYGQWAFTSDWGWVWVPGTVWAPAWVAWREGGGYCGWVPLAPECCEYPGEVVEVDRYCPRDRYVFCEERDFNQNRIDHDIVRNNVTIINNTTNITNVTIVNNTVINRGVDPEHIHQATGVETQRLHLADATNAADARRFSQHGTPVRYDNTAIAAARQKQLEQQEQLKQEHAKQVQDQQQLQNQKQKDRQDLLDLQHQKQVDQTLDRQKAADQARQAAEDKKLAEQKAAEQQQQERQKQLEQQRLDREKQAEQAKLAHDQQVQAAEQQKQQQQLQRQQAERDRIAAEKAAAQKAAADRAAAEKAAADAGANRGNNPLKGKPKPGQSGADNQQQ